MKLPHLSMGMTNDFPVAVEEGATLVRVGTAIFGERSRPAAINLEGCPPCRPKFRATTERVPPCLRVLRSTHHAFGANEHPADRQ